LLAEHGKRATILAGGTDLVHRINYYELKPEMLLYIGGLGLDYLKEEGGQLIIGATTPTAKLASSSLVEKKAAALAEAARHSGCVATRTAATIGGNLATASPAADLATPLLAMDAELQMTSTKGTRAVALRDFFTGPGETVLRADELISEIRVPMPRGKTVFVKLGKRKAMTLSVVNVAVHLVMDGKTCKDACIALGSMAPTPLRCVKAEKQIKGKQVAKPLIDACADQAVAEANPIDDQRATAWYRKKAGKALIARALGKATGIEA
jgi:CO/xanthine dehydrogenase FAD-binding subunit